MEDRIRYLFRQYLENKCSRQELEEFFSYIQASGHDEALRSLIRKVYENTEQLPSIQTYVNEHGTLVLPDRTGGSDVPVAPGQTHRRLVTGLVIFACLAIFGTGIWLIRPATHTTTASMAPPLTKKVTEPSEYKYLLLPDSTQVWLNASSTLEFPEHFRTDKREVTLSGEAYFDVRHSENAPFIIHTGKVSTTVLGTSFNIKAYPDRQHVIVSVSTGKVKVSYDNTPLVTLVKGQQVKVNSKLNTVEEKKIEPAEVAAWQKGNMSYDDEALEDIVADLERLYNVKIRIDNDAIRTLKVSTSFRREIGIEQALQVLCKLTDTMLRQSDGWYIIQ
ncbi:MAG TPA: FecR domain-containing protein [Puia sp.]|nr:FecR domain-containing protein [Puia sp.]